MLTFLLKYAPLGPESKLPKSCCCCCCSVSQLERFSSLLFCAEMISDVVGFGLGPSLDKLVQVDEGVRCFQRLHARFATE